MSDKNYILVTSLNGQTQARLCQGEHALLDLGQMLKNYLFSALNINKIELVCTKSAKSATNLFTITAKREGLENPSILYVSTNMDQAQAFYGEQNRLEHGLNKLELGLNKMHFKALAKIIDSLVLAGDLNYLPKKLGKKGLTYKNMPKILIAELDDDSKRINQLATNDALFIGIESSDTYEANELNPHWENKSQLQALKDYIAGTHPDNKSQLNDLQKMQKPIDEGYIAWKAYDEDGDIDFTSHIKNPEYVEDSLFLSEKFNNIFNQATNKEFGLLTLEKSKFFKESPCMSFFSSFGVIDVVAEAGCKANSLLPIKSITRNDNLKETLLESLKNDSELASSLTKALSLYWLSTVDAGDIYGGRQVVTENLRDFSIHKDVISPRSSKDYNGRIRPGIMLFNLKINSDMLGLSNGSSGIDIVLCRKNHSSNSYVLFIGKTDQNNEEFSQKDVIVSRNPAILCSELMNYLWGIMESESSKLLKHDFQDILHLIDLSHLNAATSEDLFHLTERQ